MTRRTRFTLVVAALPLLFTAACSNADDDGDPETFAPDGEIPAESVEAQFEDYLVESGVTEYADLACEPIEDKVDATSTCTVTIDDVTGDVTAIIEASDESSTTVVFDDTGFGE